VPSILDRIFGRKTVEKKVEDTTQKVSEEAARLRREALDKERQANEAARLAGIEAEKKRLAAIEAAKQAGTSVQAAVEKVTAQAAAIVGTRTYVVQSGDSLSKIAKELLGDAKRWPEIYEANKALVGDNPNLIHPGQKLVIP
jgi:nucleoid-associated protein YgaU